jgi:acetophenone carboxylase|tara:strand:+ start:88 stop:471 length:384 start_codon:yes stop_codon:yes gene_type:complete
MERIQFTEYLQLDLDEECWYCTSCGHNLVSAHENYKTGCLVVDRDPTEIHNPVIQGDFTFSPDPDWVRILEFYCPKCGRQIETEYLPPGHPITHDIEVDIAKLKARVNDGELRILDGRLYLAGEGGE